MKTVWTKGVAGREEEITSSFKASAMIRGRLKELLSEKIAIKLKARTNESSYESPNWAYMQADAVGYTRALEEVISLISE